jgi:hypothetical protein
MRSTLAFTLAVTAGFCTTALADAQQNFDDNNGLLQTDYSHLGMSLALDNCKNNYVARVRANKSLAPFSEFRAGSADAYINRFMVAFFGPDGNLIDAYAQPLELRTIIDGGDNFQFTQQIKDNAYRVSAGTSVRVIDTGDRDWMVQAQPLETVPDYVPEGTYAVQKVSSGNPQGYSFAYHLITLHDDTNTENRTDDDEATSDCIFYYVVE